MLVLAEVCTLWMLLFLLLWWLVMLLLMTCVPVHILSRHAMHSADYLLSLVWRCLTLCLIIYEILQSAHRPSDSRWRLIFSLPISTFSALGVSHVLRSINVRYLLYLLTLCCRKTSVRLSVRLSVCSSHAGILSKRQYISSNIFWPTCSHTILVFFP